VLVFGGYVLGVGGRMDVFVAAAVRGVGP